MKHIRAVIKAVKLGQVRAALKTAGVSILKEDAIFSHGRKKGKAAFLRGAGHVINFIEKVNIEVAVPDELVGRIIEIIGNAAKTKREGDCRFQILPLIGTI